jgi:HEAT repeat protein
LLGERIPLHTRISIEPVLNALDAEDVETRRGAAEALEQFGPEIPVERLIPLLEVDDVRVARTVAKRGRREGIEALVASLRLPRPYAWQAATALGDIGAYAPAAPLVTALSHSDSGVRTAVAEALYQTHPEILTQLAPELVETLTSGRVGPLLEPLQRVWMTQSLAALHSPQPAIVAWLSAALDAAEWEVRTWAAFGLRWVEPPMHEATREQLQRLLDDPESVSVRAAARSTLAVLAPQNTEAHETQQE